MSVDGNVVPISKNTVADYRKIARKAGKVRRDAIRRQADVQWQV